MNEIASTKSLSGAPFEADINVAAAKADGLGCHAGKEMREAAEAAGKSETLARYAKDYPVGPHDQPQSMCPAFGSLRVGLRMRRTATVLSGSACCVYGLTFTSHFYGARRTVGYVPFNSETLVTGKLFEDIREAVFKLADPAQIRRDRRHQSVRADRLRRAAAAAAQGDQWRAHHRHRRARLRRADPCGSQGRAGRRDAELRAARGRAGSGAGAARARSEKPTVTLLGEMFPADPVRIGGMLEPLGLAAGPVVPTREWRELYAALDCAAVAAIHPFYTACVREFEAAGRPVVGSAPGRLRRDRGVARTRSARPAACRARRSTPPRTGCCRRSAARSRKRRSAAASRCRATRARSCWSAACWSRAAPTCAMSEPPARARVLASDDREWLEAQGVHVQYRASLEQDLAAMRGVRAGSRDRHDAGGAGGQGTAIPALYFTNLISARPLMGVAGAGSLAQVINAALAQPDAASTR